MPAKKQVPSNTSPKPATPSEPKTLESKKTSGGLTGKTGAAAIALVALCVLTVAIVMAVRNTSDPADVAAAGAESATDRANATQPTTPLVSSVKAPVASAKTTTAASNAAVASGTTTAPKSSSGISATVTIAGCLDRADKGFRLKDTKGEDAPKSRSWKSGFLKKGSASVELSDASNAAHLADHVGQRVSVTGTLIDRQMLVQSLQRQSASCK
jgi:hypothetical protein